MAFVSNTNYADTGLAGYVRDLRARFSAWRTRRAVYEQTWRELDSLSDPDLADLGIARSDIGRVARQAADMQH
jgi:uncharacterized protein YjiS (DUF1127 family)